MLRRAEVAIWCQDRPFHTHPYRRLRLTKKHISRFDPNKRPLDHHMYGYIELVYAIKSSNIDQRVHLDLHLIECYFCCHFRFLLPIQVLYSIKYDVKLVFCWGQNVLTQKQRCWFSLSLTFSKSKSFIFLPLIQLVVSKYNSYFLFIS